jgi:hypothetical protein
MKIIKRDAYLAMALLSVISLKAYQIDIKTPFSTMLILENVPEGATLQTIKAHLQAAPALSSLLTKHHKESPYWTSFNDMDWKIMFNGHVLTQEDITSGQLKHNRLLLVVSK